VEDRLIEEVIPEESRDMLCSVEPESVDANDFDHPLAVAEEKSCSVLFDRISCLRTI
jgi:hypothetical protein